jgi:hypothetical protein
MSTLRYNERSWAIDLISLVNQKAPDLRGPVRRAGGEHTLSADNGRLFPDVLLFGDGSCIAMGWELKMPDTPITDHELIENAQKKSSLLNTKSFLLWNVNTAVLYLKNASGFSPAKTWNLAGEPATRQTTEKSRNRWEPLLSVILADINQYLTSGKITPEPLSLSISEGILPLFVLQYAEGLAKDIEHQARTNGQLRAQINLYWEAVKAEYPDQNKWELLAKMTLVGWCNRFLFAHLLKKAIPAIQPHLEKIQQGVSPAEAVSIFLNLSKQFNFWNVFRDQPGDIALGADAWNATLQIHTMFADMDFVELEHSRLQELLERSLEHARRKTSGQFTTPRPLARLLANLALNNREMVVHDPCCGTGTIARAAYDLKVESGIPTKTAAREVFASDKVAYPLQMATLALTEFEHIGEIIRIFKSGCEDLSLGSTIEFRDPNSGRPVPLKYTGADCFVSNFPFIRQEHIGTLNPTLREKANNIISRHLGKKYALPGKSDLYAYLPFLLWDKLSDQGKLAFISSNAWMAVEWGKDFRMLLHQFYSFETVLVSGTERWFKNADVVASVLILSKRHNPGTAKADETICFATLNQPLDSLSDADSQDVADRISLGKPSSQVTIKCYPATTAMDFSLSWNALFSDISWLASIEALLVPASDLFDISRGERRGWDKMFFPPESNPIESCYLKPVLKNLRNTTTYCTTPTAHAFCCGNSLDELKTLGHGGALTWIRTFEHGVNHKNKPLPEALKRAGCHWYEMKPDALADLVAQINYGDRLFIAKLEERSFVNQRLIRLRKRDNGLDTALIHALLNSIAGLFFLESLGFGRGLGALDLSSTRLREGLKVLNPGMLSKEQAEQIKAAFRPVATRKVLPLGVELSQNDRKRFDRTVLEAFRIGKHHKAIEDSLRTLNGIRYIPRKQE